MNEIINGRIKEIKELNNYKNKNYQLKYKVVLLNQTYNLLNRNNLKIKNNLIKVYRIIYKDNKKVEMKNIENKNI